MRILCHILASVVSVMALFAGSLCASPSKQERIDFSGFQRENADATIKTLISNAWEKVVRERHDSAAAYYSLAASRFSESLSEQDIRRCAIACVNMGYIWISWRMNAAEAYPWFMKARAISEKYDIKEVNTAVVSGLGQIYFDYNNIPKATELFKETLLSVMEDECSERYFGRALVDFMTAAMFEGRVALDGDLIDRIGDYKIAPDIPLSSYSRKLSGAMPLYMSGDVKDAAAMLDGADSLMVIDSDLGRYRAMHSIILGKMWLEAGVEEKAGSEFRKVIDIASREGFFNLMEKGYAGLEECSRRRGDHEAVRDCRFEAMRIRDSLFNASRFEVVKDLEIADELHGLNENVRTATREAEFHRQRLLWATVTGAVLLLALLFLYLSHRRLRSAYREIFKRNMELSVSQSAMDKVNRKEDGFGPSGKESAQESATVCREMLSRVINVMETDREIYSPDFSVDRLAEILDSRPKIVSHAINSLTGKNFNTLLGEYRVREACRILADPENIKIMTMDGVSERVGYRSRTYFSRVFKTVTGLTPTQFSRQAKDSCASRVEADDSFADC